MARRTEPTTWVAFLRAINVGGRNVTMAELRQVFEDAGYDGVQSYIASGNIILRGSTDRDSQTLEATIEADLEAALGYPVSTFVRAPAELVAIADAAFVGTPGSHQVGLLKHEPDADAQAAVSSLSNEHDMVEVVERQVHWLRPDAAASRLVTGKFERALGQPATFRTVNTLRAIARKWG